MTKLTNFTLIKRAKQLAIEETKAKVLKVLEDMFEFSNPDDICFESVKEEVAKIK